MGYMVYVYEACAVCDMYGMDGIIWHHHSAPSSSPWSHDRHRHHHATCYRQERHLQSGFDRRISLRPDVRLRIIKHVTTQRSCSCNSSPQRVENGGVDASFTYIRLVSVVVFLWCRVLSGIMLQVTFSTIIILQVITAACWNEPYLHTSGLGRRISMIQRSLRDHVAGYPSTVMILQLSTAACRTRCNRYKLYLHTSGLGRRISWYKILSGIMKQVTHQRS